MARERRAPSWVAILLVSCLSALAFPGAGRAASSQSSLDVVLILDQSGSMKQSDPARALLRAVATFAERLGNQDAFGLVVFGGQSRVACPLSPLSTDAVRREALEEIGRVRYSEPRTNIASGIERGLYELRVRGRAEATLTFLISILFSGDWAHEGVWHASCLCNDRKRKWEFLW